MNHYPNGTLTPANTSMAPGEAAVRNTFAPRVAPPPQKVRDQQDYNRLFVDDASVARRPIYLVQDGLKDQQGPFTVHTEAICAVWTTSSKSQDAMRDLPLATSGFNGTTVDGSIPATAFWKAQSNTTAGEQVTLPDGITAVLVIPAAGTSCRIAIARV